MKAQVQVPSAAEAAELRSLAREWLSLLRTRVATLVFLTALVGGMLATGPGVMPASAIEAALYITLVTGCASVLNQVLERDTDALMHRTAQRPLVTGRIEVGHALTFAVALGAAGTAGLALRFGLLSAVLVLATLVAYVGIYTPLKRVSTMNTVVGAIPGAAPPLIGYAAVAGEVGPWAWALFAVIFAWQFPHFMAIAWLYREDYARAGHRMLPAVPGSDGVAGRQAVLYSLALLPISLLPALRLEAGPLYVVGALVLGLAYLAASVAFALREDRRRARGLLFTSLVYLPLLLVLILLDPVVAAGL
ncbi:MAG: heme o synthase [Planctomycetota bacterium]|nr:heme o synthase [Planctomycetota bacterium]